MSESHSLPACADSACRPRPPRPVFAMAFMLALAIVAAEPARAQAELVADLNTGRGPTDSSRPQEFALLGDISYFQACDPRHGCELWRSDGSAAGTTLAADVCPGPCDSRPSQLFAHAGLLYFSADDGQHGQEPWRHDPQAATTTLIVDALPGPQPSFPAVFRATTGGAPAGSVLFRTSDPDSFASNFGDGLWLVQADSGAFELALGGLTRIASVTPVGARVFLAAEDPDDNEGQELWVLNFAPGLPPVQRVRDIAPGPADSQIDQMHALPTRNGVVFRASDGVSGSEPWFSDGTLAGTQRIADINPGAASSFVREILPTAGGSVFFLADDGAGSPSRDLWLAFGSPFTVTKVRDFPNSRTSNLAIAGNTLFFVADAGTGRGREFWLSGGLPQTTLPVASGFAQDFDTFMGHAVVGDYYYVVSFSTLYRTAGTTTSTQRVGPLNEPQIPVYSLHGRGDGVLFGFNRLDGVGDELYGSRLADPSRADIVRDIHDSTGSSNPSRFLALANGRVFSAFDEDSFETMRRIDDDGGVSLLLPPGERLFHTSRTTVVTRSGPATLFAKNFQNRIWRSDGSAAGTTVVLDTAQPPFINGNVRCIDAQSPTDLLLLVEENGVPALWRSDATAGGSERLLAPEDLPPDTFILDEPCPVRLGNQILFVAQNPNNGVELFRNDGTPGHIALVRDISPGAGNGLLGATFVVAQGQLFFAANSGGPTAADADVELWVSDGTGQGTLRLRDIHPDGSSNPHSIIPHDDGVAFAARAGDGGHQLWISDGSSAGTRALTNVAPQAEFFELPVGETFGPAIASDGGRLFFFATLIGDGGGSHLFTSNGEVDGHRRIQPPGATAAIAPQQLQVIEDAGVIFAGYSPELGREAWFSDGSDAGTFAAVDIAPGPAGSGPLALTLLDDGAYVGADDGSIGREPWRLPIPRAETIFADGFDLP